MQEEKLSWSKGFALVCAKCSERKNGVEAGLALSVRDFLKDELKKTQEWGALRVMSSSCQGLCPEGKLALSIHPEGGPSKILSCDANEDKAAILSKIRQEIF